MKTEAPLVFVPITYQKGGTEEVLSCQTGDFGNKGIPVYALLPKDERLDTFARELSESDCKVVRISPLFSSDRNKRASFLEMFHLLRAIRPQLVHFHVPWAPTGAEALLAAYAAGVPHIVRTDHNPIMQPLPTRQLIKMHVLDSLVEANVFVSEGNREKHITYGRRIRKKSLVIPNGIDTKVIEASVSEQQKNAIRSRIGLSPEATLVVAIASLEERKGTLDFIRAAARASQIADNLIFVMIGDGTLRSQAEELAKCLDVHINFLGHRNDVEAILPAFDIFVQASHYEGMALAMLKALAAGLPMVSTRVDGVADVLQEQEAILVPIGATDALADGIASLAKDVRLRQNLGFTLSNRVRDSFTTGKMLNRYLELYARLGINV